MKVRHAMFMVLALAVLAGPLGGCRSSRKQAPQQPVAMQQAPRVVQMPSAPAYTASRPAPPTAPPANWGTPDGAMTPSASSAFAAQPPSPFPAAEPAPSPVAVLDAGTTTTAIVGERESRQHIDQQIVALEERMREAERAISQVNAPPATSAAPNATGGQAQAAHFAALMKSRSGGQVEQRGSLVVLRFSDAFKSGSEKLKPDPRISSGLLAAANELAKTPGVQIQVVGHSDGQKLKVSKERWGTNVKLSRERAQTVATELAKHGVPASRIGVDGRGSVEPLVFPEKTANDRAQNRRVEILVRF